jgi:ABC-type nickel/cobalt efflux system permease component RcnA
VNTGPDLQLHGFGDLHEFLVEYLRDLRVGEGIGGHHDHHHALGWKGLLGMGTAAGLIPCPSALVVLLAAISQHEVALGLVLITAFSLGLAARRGGISLRASCNQLEEDSR